MKKSFIKKALSALFLTSVLLVSLLVAASHATEYPRKPIEMVVPYAAGGGTHIAAEILVPGADKFLGQPIQITCKPGAGGAIGATYVAKAPKDGYTLLYTTLSLSIAPYIGKVGYKVDDFIGIAQCSDVASVIAVRADAPFDDAAGMVKWIRENPGKFTWTHPGVGSSLHIQGANVFYQAGVVKETKDIPNKGTAPGIAAVLGGHVTAISSFLPALSENVKVGSLKVIGVVGDKRLEEMPKLKTFPEQGVPAKVTSWRGVFVHKDTPPKVIKYLENAFAKIIATDEYKERNKKLGEPLVYSDSAVFTKLAQDQAKDMQILLKEMGLAVK